MRTRVSLVSQSRKKSNIVCREKQIGVIVEQIGKRGDKRKDDVEFVVFSPTFSSVAKQGIDSVAARRERERLRKRRQWLTSVWTADCGTHKSCDCLVRAVWNILFLFLFSL